MSRRWLDGAAIGFSLIVCALALAACVWNNGQCGTPGYGRVLPCDPPTQPDHPPGPDLSLSF